MTCNENLKEEKRKPRGEMLIVFKYLKGAYKNDGDKLFSTAIGQGIMVSSCMNGNLDWILERTFLP